jgi:hypothetical protein
MGLAVRLDDGLTPLTVERKPHGQNAFGRVAHLTARGRHIRLAGRGTRAVVEDPLDRVGRQTRSVVGDDDLAAHGRNFDRNFGCDLGFFAAVERVIDKLF